MKKWLVALFAPLLVVLLAAATDTTLQPLKDEQFAEHSAAKVELGRLLFYDRVLSGTYRVSCATCHHHDRASTNGFAIVPVDKEARDDLAINGLPLYDALKPSSRHAPPLFNLGLKSLRSLFADGRVSRNADGGFDTPAGFELPDGLESIVAAQALFPAVTRDELTGTVQTDLSPALHMGNRAIWDALAGRIRDLPDYWPHFQKAYPHMKSLKDVGIADIANAIGAFVATEWRSDNAPFDRFLRGDTEALSEAQKRGMNLFYGKAGCSACHSGVLQSDRDYYALGGWPWRFDADFSLDLPKILRGRIEVTGRDKDLYRLKTPSLRNVELTAPYGHAGGYETLRDVIEQHADPNRSYGKILKRYREAGAPVPQARQAAYRAVMARRDGSDKLSGAKLDAQMMADLVDFLKSLTDERGAHGRLGKPTEVPSALFVD